ALAVLSFPKTLGKHPSTGFDVTVHDGKFGPYVQMLGDGGQKESRSLASREQMLALTLDEAVAALAQPRQQRGRQQVQAPIASLGVSELTKQPIEVRMGRFGAYVTDGVVNATIPSGRDPAKLTQEVALELIAQREQRLREQGIDPRAQKSGGGGRGRGRGGRAGRPGARRSPLPRVPTPAKAASTIKAAKPVASKKAPAKKSAAPKKAAKKASLRAKSPPTTKKKKKATR
ncbi:MAG TPA: topoisomerase C-terminal repeat-containing protein, partial [Myxococcota bacterium]